MTEAFRMSQQQQEEGWQSGRGAHGEKTTEGPLTEKLGQDS